MGDEVGGADRPRSLFSKGVFDPSRPDRVVMMKALLNPIGGQGVREERDQITHLLEKWQGGDRAALDELLPLVLHQLRAKARSLLAHERRDHTFSTSDLVNEAYQKLFAMGAGSWKDRGHFFAVAGKVMRNILITHAYSRNTQKRGGGEVERVPIDLTTLGDEPFQVLTELDEALELLETRDQMTARVISLHCFCGFTIEEVSQILPVSASTAKRKLKLGRAFLGRCLSRGHEEQSRAGG